MISSASTTSACLIVFQLAPWTNSYRDIILSLLDLHRPNSTHPSSSFLTLSILCWWWVSGLQKQEYPYPTTRSFVRVWTCFGISLIDMTSPFTLISLKSELKLSRLLTSPNGYMTDLFSAQLYFRIRYSPNASSQYYRILLSSSFHLFSQSTIYVHPISTYINKQSQTSLSRSSNVQVWWCTDFYKTKEMLPNLMELEDISNLNDWQGILATHVHLNIIAKLFLYFQYHDARHQW